MGYPQIGRRIVGLRKRLGLTQEALAERAGIDNTYLARIEAGSRSPSLEVLHAVAAGLGVPVGRLFVARRVLTAGDGAWGREIDRLAEELEGLPAEDVRQIVGAVKILRSR